MPKDITHPAVIIFFKEMYEKEKIVRAQWIFKHQDQLQHAATLQRDPTNYYESDVEAEKMIGGLATITRDHVVAGYNRRKTPLRDAVNVPCTKDIRHDHSIIDIGIGDPVKDSRLSRPDTDLSPDPVMRPIDPKVKRILLKPKPTFGRETYLKVRADMIPEKKYYFPECVNWDYGWRIADGGKRQRPQYGRCWLLQRIVHSRVGPQPDPKYYRSVDIAGPAKCVNI